MKVEEKKEDFTPFTIELTIESKDEAVRLREILRSQISGRDELNQIVNILNKNIL